MQMQHTTQAAAADWRWRLYMNIIGHGHIAHAQPPRAIIGISTWRFALLHLPG
jgi:hypothetical protein